MIWAEATIPAAFARLDVAPLGAPADIEVLHRARATIGRGGVKWWEGRHGFLLFSWQRKQTLAVLHTVYVDPEWRSQGWGTAFADHWRSVMRDEYAVQCWRAKFRESHATGFCRRIGGSVWQLPNEYRAAGWIDARRQNLPLPKWLTSFTNGHPLAR